MSTSETTTGKHTKLYAILAIGAVIAVAIGLMSLRPKTTTPTHERGGPGPQDDALASARETLYQGTDLASCRSALQSVNQHFSRNGQERPRPLTDKERDQLVDLLGLDADELAEVNSGTFTPLDAHYLDECFLMRDAARSLDVEGLAPLKQAEAAFRWVVRQVRLRARAEYPPPPAFVLRRGWGTPLERSLVFLALLKQLNLDGCMIACPMQAGSSASVPWLPGALIGRDIFLFDTRLGLPLPGPRGQGIATLVQVRTRPDVLKQLTIDPKSAYDVTPKQASRAEVQLVCALSGLAPRMKYFQGILTASNQVGLTDDPVALRDKFRRATGKQGIEVRFWDHPGDPVLPARLLRHFLPPEEGGTDEARFKQRLEMELFPWEVLPAQVRDLPDNVQPGLWLRYYFAELFEDFPITAQAVATLVNKQNSSDEVLVDSSLPVQELEDDPGKRVAYLFLTGAGLQAHAAHGYTHFSLAPRTPRDQILRGRFDEAAERLVNARDQARFQEEQARGASGLDRQMADWAEHAQDAQLAFQRARDAEAKGKNRDPQAVNKARARMVSVWPIIPARQLRGAQGHIPFPPWLVLLLKVTAEPIGNEATYLLALCKHEQAEREQARLAAVRVPSHADAAAAREAWERADHWWKSYLEDYPSGAGAGAARRLRAEALAALGQPADAAGLLEDLSDKPPDLEKTARLYRARQLKAGAAQRQPRPGAGKHR